MQGRDPTEHSRARAQGHGWGRVLGWVGLELSDDLAGRGRQAHLSSPTLKTAVTCNLRHTQGDVCVPGYESGRKKQEGMTSTSTVMVWM